MIDFIETDILLRSCVKCPLPLVAQVAFAASTIPECDGIKEYGEGYLIITYREVFLMQQMRHITKSNS